MTVNEQERAELLQTLAQHRWFLTNTADGLTDEQARSTPTVSELSIGGIIKHVTEVETQWASFIVGGPDAFGWTGESGWSADAFVMTTSLDEARAAYAEVAAHTEQVVRDLASLDDGHLLPKAPWFPPETTWSARRVLLQVIAETAQHSGHADIIRETIDGRKSMG